VFFLVAQADKQEDTKTTAVSSHWILLFGTVQSSRPLTYMQKVKKANWFKSCEASKS
jgi:hypothetical protein